MLGDTMRRRQPPASKKRPRTTRTAGGRLRWTLIATGTAAGCFVVGYLLAVFVFFPVPDPATEGMVEVPRLVGRDLNGAERALDAVGLTVEGTMEVAHPTEPAGLILAQTPLAGQRLRPGGTVRLAISAGRARGRVPDLTGLPVDDAVTLAERLGFQTLMREEPTQGPGGVVLGVDPAPGTTRDLPATLTLVVSVPAPPPEEIPMDTVSLSPAGGPGVGERR